MKKVRVKCVLNQICQLKIANRFFKFLSNRAYKKAFGISFFNSILKLKTIQLFYFILFNLFFIQI